MNDHMTDFATWPLSDAITEQAINRAYQAIRRLAVYEDADEARTIDRRAQERKDRERE